MGMMPDRLPGYRRVADEGARSEFETLWKSRVPAAPGQGARAVLNDLGHGSVKALWLCRYDPVGSAFVGKSDGSRACSVELLHSIRQARKPARRADWLGGHGAPGSIGASSFPSRVLPGMRMGGHMGDEQVTVRNLEVIDVDTEDNVLVVKGAVPGPNGGFVVVKRAKR